MTRISFAILLMILIQEPLSAQSGFEKVKIGEEVTAKVPVDWTLMNQAEIIAASVASTPPLAMYGSQD